MRPEERDLVLGLVDRSDRLETAAKIRRSWDAVVSVVSFLAGVSLVVLIRDDVEITLGTLWICTAGLAVYTAARVMFLRRGLTTRQRARQAEVDPPTPSA